MNEYKFNFKQISREIQKTQSPKPGDIVMYSGNDGYKFYVVLSRSGDHCICSMVSNPDWQVGPRALTRNLHVYYLTVIDPATWLQWQTEFVTSLLESANERFSTFQNTNK